MIGRERALGSWRNKKVEEQVDGKIQRTRRNLAQLTAPHSFASKRPEASAFPIVRFDNFSGTLILPHNNEISQWEISVYFGQFPADWCLQFPPGCFIWTEVCAAAWSRGAEGAGVVASDRWPALASARRVRTNTGQQNTSRTLTWPRLGKKSEGIGRDLHQYILCMCVRVRMYRVGTPTNRFGWP